MKNPYRYSQKISTGSKVKTILASFLLILYLVPFALVAINSLKQKINIVRFPLELVDPKGPQWINYKHAIEEMAFFRSFGNSFIITSCSVVLLLVFSAMAAYIFVRASEWKACKISFALLLASMAVPFQVVMIPLISIYGGIFGILNSKTTLILMNFGFGTGLCIFMCDGFIKTSVPIALEEAATIDGCSYHGIFFRIVLPLMKPILSTIAILQILGFWNDYLLPSLVLGKKRLYTLPLAIRTFYGTFTNDYGNIMAGLMLSIIPIIIVYIFLQKYIIGGVIAGAVKS
ncbi:MAG: carbohydrate ABC transporter permease [Spirochaetia bacterium]|jgi:raffinose/stachyose/melibiose transport system permease protein|nr:carbohydrate ABC transporter permease [Spirochaetia bacterium]